MNFDHLINEAKTHAQRNYLNKPALGHDEQLQLLSCGYSVLYLSARSNKTLPELGKAHEFVARCFEKIGDEKFAERHLKTAASYLKAK